MNACKFKSGSIILTGYCRQELKALMELLGPAMFELFITAIGSLSMLKKKQLTDCLSKMIFK
jgi:hypothetical protein